VQLLQCIADSGYFTLSFRQQVTPPIFYNSTAIQVQEILSSLPNIQKIQVSFIADGPPPVGTLTYAKPVLSLPEGMPLWGQFNQAGEFVYIPRNNTPSGFPTIACDVYGQQVIIINFIATHGALPPLQPDVSKLIDTYHTVGYLGSGTINVFTDGQSVLGLTSIQGTTENDPCNNRGICNYVTGVCACFPAWGSSDGAGGPGERGDCGYRNDNLY
jgi:hypothetical protein